MKLKKGQERFLAHAKDAKQFMYVLFLIAQYFLIKI
jgi:hypothetical protein